MKKMLAVLIISILIIGLSGCGGNKEVQVIEQGKEVVEVDANYEVVKKEDLSNLNAKRYNYHIVIDDKLNVEKLKEISKQIIEVAKAEESFNAIVIGFYDYEEYIGAGYPLGKVEYAPDGDWGRANTVKAGEYDKMDYNFELKEKDWDKQLTKEEVEIYKAWQDFNEENNDEEEAGKVIAERFDKTVEEVQSILMKQMAWIYN